MLGDNIRGTPVIYDMITLITLSEKVYNLWKEQYISDLHGG